jgi:hypothetical protein
VKLKTAKHGIHPRPVHREHRNGGREEEQDDRQAGVHQHVAFGKLSEVGARSRLPGTVMLLTVWSWRAIL